MKQVGVPNKTVLSRLKAGDVSAGNYLEIEPDGTVIAKGDGTVWDEILQTLVGLNLYTVAGRVDYNFSELTVDFATNARYPEEPIGMVSQMMHSRKAGSDIRPHVHWIQTSDANPNILIEYRWYNNGEPVSASWTKVALTPANNLYDYDDSGAMQQITQMPLPGDLGLTKGLSSTFDVKIYRDTANTSTLFAESDTYVGLWNAKYFDIHIEKDMNGSHQEYIK